ncbi:hypothetical protein BALAC2494_01538 [Bifidobacterium animalis subsp. lactis CNCM I-2494]|uniref:Uncharacterized protein n=1 Tax=Bifidobacterium animalis subsp. lactis CNCM I-2494 TaxID=1042403 RepID=A0A806FW24_BIFAN|nr:hypothetical protein BALAC2494_01538 [Bifidobacterium animalis subsp. lactis CNCM I-2494]
MSMYDVCHAYGQQLFWGDPACVGMRDLPFVGAAVHGRESFAHGRVSSNDAGYQRDDIVCLRLRVNVG